jgi:hypothetical protein
MGCAFEVSSFISEGQTTPQYPVAHFSQPSQNPTISF